MRAGFWISLLSHTGLIALGLVVLPGTRVLSSPPVEALPVEFVSPDELSNLVQGDPQARKQEQAAKAAEAARLEAEQQAAKAAEAARLEAEQQAAKAAEAARLEAEQQAAKAAEAAWLEAEQQAAKAAEAARLEAEQQAAKAAEAARLEAEQQAAKAAEAARLEAEQQAAKAAEAARAQKAKRVAQLAEHARKALAQQARRKAQAQQAKDAAARRQTSTAGVRKSTRTGRLTLGELEAVRAQVHNCWQVPPHLADKTHIRIVMRVYLDKDGALKARPQVLNTDSDLHFRAMAGAARRALQRCGRLTLPREKYDAWKTLKFIFSKDGVARG